MIRNGAYTEIGQRAWSYDTMLRDVLPDGRSIGNVTKYTPTTSRHQRYAEVSHCDIKVDDVPRGTENLARWYLRQQERAAGLPALHWGEPEPAFGPGPGGQG